MACMDEKNNESWGCKDREYWHWILFKEPDGKTLIMYFNKDK